jgi:hypothetical protein
VRFAFLFQPLPPPAPSSLTLSLPLLQTQKSHSYINYYLMRMIMIVNSCINYLWSLEIREVARHWIGHVGAAEAIWKMKCSVNSVSQHVTLQLTYFVMSVLSVKKVVSSAAECPILASMRNQYWLWSPQESRAWVVKLEKYPFPSWKWYTCVC